MAGPSQNPVDSITLILKAILSSGTVMNLCSQSRTVQCEGADRIAFPFRVFEQEPGEDV